MKKIPPFGFAKTGNLEKISLTNCMGLYGPLQIPPFGFAKTGNPEKILRRKCMGLYMTSKICKIQPPSFADFRVEIVPNSTHFQDYSLWVRRLGNPDRNRLRRRCTEFYCEKQKYCVAKEVLVKKK